MEGERLRPQDAGIGELVSRLAVDAREMAQAEVALVKARTTFAVTRYKWAAIYFGAAAALAFTGLIALLIGLIFTLSTLIGPGWATLAVVGTVFVIVGALALAGKAQLKKKVTA